MGSLTGSAVRDAAGFAGAGRARAPLAFGAATFLGAFLLFLVQPLVAKYLLPWFGGGPAVWTTCVLFFQVVLVGGYTYAHLGVRRLSPRAQAAVHVGLLTAAVLVTIGVVATNPSRPLAGAGAPGRSPVSQILLMLAAAVALPCLALSATSPLLNAWYVRAVPAAGAGVYRLYAVSNAGSLLALLAYPFLIEPALTRRAQAALWCAGLALFAVLCGYCAREAARARGPSAGDADAPVCDDDGPAAGWGTRLLWLALPACASVLLLAVTNTMTHDVAAMPMLWVLPLVLYLLTFILAFDAPRWYRRGVVGAALPLAALGVCAVLLGADTLLSIGGRVALLAGALFVCCFACHGELAALKPPPRQLTGYYLTIAVGGALGGALVAVVAPAALDRYAELHVGLWACCALALVAPFAGRGRRRARFSAAVMMPAIVGLVVLAAMLWEARDPYPFAGGKAVGRWRDFYGVVTLYEAHREDPRRASVLFRHAGVTHGLQFTAPEKRWAPTTYFGPASGVAVALWEAGPGPRRVGIVGLGAGTLAAYGAAGDTFRFYELSPTVEAVARDRFTYLADSAARVEVVAGDGRLSLEREPPQAFDVLVLDAFTGHAIPYHLLTAEAFDTYRRHLKPGGVIAVNVSNAHVDIQPVVAQQAARGGWEALLVSSPKGDELDGLLEADWALLTDDAVRLERFERAGGVRPREDPGLRLWTDEYASVYPVLR